MQLAALSELEPSVVRPGPAVLKNLLGASYLQPDLGIITWSYVSHPWLLSKSLLTSQATVDTDNIVVLLMGLFTLRQPICLTWKGRKPFFCCVYLL